MTFAAQIRWAARWGGIATLAALALIALAEVTGYEAFAALAAVPGLVALILLVAGVTWRAAMRWIYLRFHAPNEAYRRMNTAYAPQRWLLWIDKDGRDRDASDPAD